MAEALHAEVDAARLLLAECRASGAPPRPAAPGRAPPTGDAATRTAAVEVAEASASSAQAELVHTIDLSQSHSADLDIEAPHSLAAPSLEVGGAVGASAGRVWPARWRVVWSVALVGVDTGLVYFCLNQGLGPSAKARLRARVAAWRSCARWQARGAEEGRGAAPPRTPAGGAGPASRRIAGADDDAPTPLSVIDPSGGHLLFRRGRTPGRGGADDEDDGVGGGSGPRHPVPRRRGLAGQAETQHRGAESERLWLSFALGALSLAGVLVMRLVISFAAWAGFHFLEHLLTYSIVTARVCLVVMLVLF